MKKTIYTFFISTILIHINFFTAFAQVQKEKDYSRNFEKNGIEKLIIIHQRGPLLLQKSTDGMIHLDLHVRITGRNEEDINTLFQSINLDDTKNGNELKITSSTNIESWNQILHKTKIKLKSGALLTDIKDMEMIMTVQAPDLNLISLENKYEQIEVGTDLAGSLEINLYSGELYAGNIGGDLILNTKYSNLNFGKITNGHFDLYESKVSGKSAGDLRIQSKYSTLKLDGCHKMMVESYEDKYTVGNIEETLAIDDKYSHFHLEDFGDAQLEMYETVFESVRGKNVTMDCKYGSFKAESLNELQLSESYETDFTIGKLNTVVAQNDKYGSFEINHLTESFSINGYESSVNVNQVSTNFKLLNIDSKYDRMQFGFPPDLHYSLDLEMKYGKITLHEEGFANMNREEKGEQLKIKAGLDDPTRKAKVVIRSYETDFILQ
ncbi:MAG: hypothetical protein KDC53_02300 [Saprospiraceae bacterium]|nr:hypothetical protein [Saprospiraceae bacterium]